METFALRAFRGPKGPDDFEIIYNILRRILGRSGHAVFAREAGLPRWTRSAQGLACLEQAFRSARQKPGILTQARKSMPA